MKSHLNLVQAVILIGPNIIASKEKGGFIKMPLCEYEKDDKMFDTLKKCLKSNYDIDVGFLEVYGKQIKINPGKDYENYLGGKKIQLSFVIGYAKKPESDKDTQIQREKLVPIKEVMEQLEKQKQNAKEEDYAYLQYQQFVLLYAKQKVFNSKGRARSKSKN